MEEYNYIHYAVNWGFYDIVQVLVNFKANIEA